MTNTTQNKVLFLAKTEKAIKTSLIKGLNQLYPNVADIHTTIKINKPDTECKLRNIVVSAICKIADEDTAIGIFSSGGDIGCAIEMTYGTHSEIMVVLPDGKVKVTNCINGDFDAYSLMNEKNNGVALIVGMLVRLTYKHEANDEFYESFKRALKIVKSGITAQNIQQFGEEAAKVSEYCYRYLCFKSFNEKYTPISDTGNIEPLLKTSFDSNKYQIIRCDKGKFQYFKALGSADEVVEPSEKKPKNDSKEFLSNRVFSEEEQRLIPKTPEWYIEPKEVNEICALINATTNTAKPKRNFMLRGPSSTGKTSMTRAIAAKLGIPYVYVTCSADTESYSFVGQPMYDESGNIKYVSSDFIKAIENGWLVEVQEPYVIAKQGVLTALNGLLDDTGGITLASGKFIKRHPDALVFFTTNVSYVGCKKPNQSVLRRMQSVYDIDMPAVPEIVARVEAVTKFNDKQLIESMVTCAKNINDYLLEQGIDDGVCGVSEIIDWVQNYQVLNDIYSAAKSTIISKASDEPEIQLAIEGLIETKIDLNGKNSKKVKFTASQVYNA